MADEGSSSVLGAQFHAFTCECGKSVSMPVTLASLRRGRLVLLLAALLVVTRLGRMGIDETYDAPGPLAQAQDMSFFPLAPPPRPKPRCGAPGPSATA